MKVSEITVSDIVNYLRLDEGEYTETEIEALFETSKAYIRSYTGLTDDEIDTHEDFYIVVMILCQDMHDNRTMYVDNKNLNRVVKTILDMHCVNLI